MTVYDYAVSAASGEMIPLEQFRGKVLMIVNTATGCGFTPQYKDLEAMYERYHAQGFEIIDIPSNQFAGQTPGTDEEIHEFCTLKYHTQFAQMKKSDVNGKDALPLYAFLKKEQGFSGFGKGPKAMLMDAMLKKSDPDYKESSDIKWNFTKFVIARSGTVIARFEPTASMKDVDTCIVSAL
jgi:glutathione peroxidase